MNNHNKPTSSPVSGVMPVMITPFTRENRLDHGALERLIEWYLGAGVDSLFAVCQSSEMQHLSLSERVALAEAVVRIVNGRVPVIASGHISEAMADQTAELLAMASTGIASLVLVTNRLDPHREGTEAFRRNLDQLLEALPHDIDLGLYECPAPYRRLLSDEELRLCRDTGRFVVLKDVSCDLATVRRRVEIVRGSRLAIVNANAAIAREAMRSGSEGFGGVFTNFHPDLYVWLYANCHRSDALAEELTAFLALSAMAEGMGYPKIAKRLHQRLGTFDCIHSRVVDYDLEDRHWAADEILSHILNAGEEFRRRIARC
ncbi:dihydrodipicolinate synthase family protein [Nitratireductor sp. GISD-1A_MAKvit]|uniref:dihydrodipicolinate synthase family protein n=1 Tax=Nitratireductor sp. GISD-1A_MAKvit TaxID=3234198 RepID=UPI003466AF2C